MYGTSHVASTPGASSTVFNREHRHSFCQRIFPSYACAFLDDDPAYERCCANSLTGSLSTCRRSRRLLSNGYYVLTEDSFLSDEEGNITLTPSQTSVTYKENLVRVFRRRKKIRRSLATLFSLGASSSWLSSTVLNNIDSSHVDDPWPDGCNKLEASQSDIESRTVQNVLSEMVALMTCLIISVCTRYLLGGLSATMLLIILVFLLSQDVAVSPFFSLDTSFKTPKF
ncbi:TMM71 protein, partial [Sagittarius serpentarius]|nr:TMM71 protein [Sagittarius serpentarius]